MSGPIAAPAPAPPRWGVQTGLVQRRQAAFYVFIALVVVCGLVILSRQLTYLANYPTVWFFSIIAIGLVAAPVAIAIYFLDQFEREPISLLIGAFVWGASVALAFALFTEPPLHRFLLGIGVPEAWATPIFAASLEEGYKYLGIVVLFLIARHEFDDPFDGFVYGALIGLGFDVFENVQYFVNAAARAGADQIGPAFGSFFERVVVLGPYSHEVFTGIAGIGFAYFVTQLDQPRNKRVAYAVGLFLLGWLAHFVWDSPLLDDVLGGNGIGGEVVYGLVKGAPFVGLLVGLVILAQRREYRLFSNVVANEVASGAITPQELTELRGFLARRRASVAVGRQKGPAGARLMGQLQRAQMNLALILTRIDRPDDPQLVAQHELIRKIRTDLQALPDVPRPPALTGPALAPPVAALSVQQAPLFSPTHYVPAPGIGAWATPDPSQPPTATLAAGVQLLVREKAGEWAHVVGSNGWSGWVDGRLLVPFMASPGASAA